ncbi:E3 ubiquitin-protein ligase RNF168-like [Sitophilus oryzae]|uniref:RING-type E3 ubiquitin transferase n=1 Tax=Sitophilus oryzae TaxID=7048 RepID=A0A6J2XME7_SITOR|nr:E3 ubiquitin-protein ligase RNF168-like [Sitophilus oryzae]
MAGKRAKLREKREKLNITNLKEVDILCPICRTIIIEPVLLPCNHAFCKQCFDGAMENTNLVCPLCRVRVGSWYRKAKKNGELVDKSFWDAIKIQYPREIQNKYNGIDNSIEEDKPLIRIAAPGEIRKEYELQLKQQKTEEAEIQKHRDIEEEKASKALIRQLKEEEEDLKRLEQERIRMDEELAKQLSKEQIPSTSKLTKKTTQKFEPSKGKFIKNNNMKLYNRSTDHDYQIKEKKEHIRRLEQEKLRLQKALSKEIQSPSTSKLSKNTPRKSGPMDSFVEKKSFKHYTLPKDQDILQINKNNGSTSRTVSPNNLSTKPYTCQVLYIDQSPTQRKSYIDANKKKSLYESLYENIYEKSLQYLAQHKRRSKETVSRDNSDVIDQECNFYFKPIDYEENSVQEPKNNLPLRVPCKKVNVTDKTDQGIIMPPCGNVVDIYTENASAFAKTLPVIKDNNKVEVSRLVPAPETNFYGFSNTDISSSLASCDNVSKWISNTTKSFFNNKARVKVTNFPTHEKEMAIDIKNHKIKREMERIQPSIVNNSLDSSNSVQRNSDFSHNPTKKMKCSNTNAKLPVVDKEIYVDIPKLKISITDAYSDKLMKCSNTNAKLPVVDKEIYVDIPKLKISMTDAYSDKLSPEIKTLNSNAVKERFNKESRRVDSFISTKQIQMQEESDFELAKKLQAEFDMIQTPLRTRRGTKRQITLDEMLLV